MIMWFQSFNDKMFRRFHIIFNLIKNASTSFSYVSWQNLQVSPSNLSSLPPHLHINYHCNISSRGHFHSRILISIAISAKFQTRLKKVPGKTKSEIFRNSPNLNFIYYIHEHFSVLISITASAKFKTKFDLT